MKGYPQPGNYDYDPSTHIIRDFQESGHTELQELCATLGVITGNLSEETLRARGSQMRA